MTTQTVDAAEIADLAKKLTEAQRDYIIAVGASDKPYTPRHGRTANWALRHKVVDTVVLLDGEKLFWSEIPAFDLPDRIYGQQLTPLGLAVRAHLLQQERSA